MKQFLTFIALLLVAAIAIILTPSARADGVQYTAISLPYPGSYSVGSGIGKLVHVRIVGAVTNSGTVIINRLVRDTSSTNVLALTTNALVTFTCASGGYEADVGGTTNVWLMAGDRIQRAGTVTSTNECLLFMQGN